MFDGIAGAVRDAVRSVKDRMDDSPLSVIPSEAKSANFSFDTVSAGWYGKNGYSKIYSALSGGLPAWSGEAVSTETALSVSTVFACYKILSESIGFLPLSMLLDTGQSKDLATGHPMFGALKYAPNEEESSQEVTERMTGHCVLTGNAYARIIRRSGTGTAIGLSVIQPEHVLVTREKAGQKRITYTVSQDHEPDVVYYVTPGKAQDVLHLRGLGWNGLTGFSVIQMARQSIGVALSQERNVAQYYAHGGRVPYILRHPAHFKSDQDFDKFRADWETTYSQPHKAPILEDGLVYEQIGLSAADAQLIESRQFTIPEICRWFGVQPNMVQDLSRATFSNIESLAEQFVRLTLMPWITRWEQSLWRCVLTPDEKTKGYEFKHNLNALLRSEFQQRMAGYASSLQNGWQNINEVRKLEDLNPIPGGDEHHIQVNLMGIDQQGNPATRVPVAGVKP